MRYLTSFVLLSVSLTLFGCNSAKQLQSSLQKNVCSLGYIHDSNRVPGKPSKTVFVVNTTGEQDLPPEMVVTLDKTKTMYLVLAAWRYEEFTCQLGKKVLKEEPTLFITDSIKDELQRSGCYSLANDRSNADFILETKLTQCKSKCVYKNQWTAVGNAQEYETSATPSTAVVSIGMVLKKGQEVLVAKDVNSVRIALYAPHSQKNVDISRNCVENMAEALSTAIKDDVEQITGIIRRTKS